MISYPKNILNQNFLEKEIKNDKRSRIFLLLIWVPIKIFIAYWIIATYDFGIYIVIGYIFYSLEDISGLQFLNRKEILLMFGKQNQSNNNQEIEKLKLRIKELEEKIEILEDNLF